MNRLSCLSRCAAVAVLLIPVLAYAQEAADPFGPVNPAAAENPDHEGGQPTTSVTKRSVLAGAMLEPAAADKATSEDFCQCVGETNSESAARIEQALQGKLTSAGFDFADAPLEEVVSFIQDAYNIPVELDSPALEEIGIGPDEPINISVHGISLRSALRLLLKQLQLTYVVQDEVLIITTPEEAESQLTVCVYDVRDLIDGSRDAAGVNALIDTIIQTVCNETWAANGGGEAAIRAVNGGLVVVSQTQAVHEEIRGLLATIRDVRGKGPVAETDAQKSAAATPGPEKAIIKAYYFSAHEPAEAEEVRQQIRQLIENAIPDVQWEGRLGDGQAVLLTVLPDRVVLKNMASVHYEVESLLVDTGLTTLPTPGGPIAGGIGGGGGGFFRPRDFN